MRKLRSWALLALVLCLFCMAASEPTGCAERREQIATITEKGGDTVTAVTPLIGPLGVPIAGICYLIASLLGKKKATALKKMHRALTDTIELGKTDEKMKPHIEAVTEYITKAKTTADAVTKELWDLETAVRKGAA